MQPAQRLDLHVVVRMNFAVTYFPANIVKQWLDVRIQVPLIDSCERGIGEGVQALGYAQVVPPANVLLVRVVGPRIVGDANDRLLDVDEASLLQQLASAVLVCDGAGNAVRGVCEPPVPFDEHTVLRKCVVVAARLHVDFDMLYPA